MGHAYLSPSAGARWPHCVGAPAMEKPYPQESSPYAERGTELHKLSERMLNGEAVEGDEDGIVEKYVQYVRQECDGTLFTEVSLPVEAVTLEEGAKGTVDALIVSEGKLKIIDLKTGRGVRVEAFENEQLEIYALAALIEFAELGPFNEVEMHIVQPPLRNVSVWHVGASALLERLADVQKSALAALKAKRGEGLTPGIKQCRFCKAAATCPALREAVNKTKGIDMDLENLQDMSPQALSEAMAATRLAKIWVTAVEKRVNGVLTSGGSVPGWKIVEGRKGFRKFVEPLMREAIEEGLVDEKDVTETVLLSPSKAEKRLKGSPSWDVVKQMIVQPAGKPQVVEDKDPRPALVPESVESCFDQFWEE